MVASCGDSVNSACIASSCFFAVSVPTLLANLLFFTGFVRVAKIIVIGPPLSSSAITTSLCLLKGDVAGTCDPDLIAGVCDSSTFMGRGIELRIPSLNVSTVLESSANSQLAFSVWLCLNLLADFVPIFFRVWILRCFMTNDDLAVTVSPRDGDLFHPYAVDIKRCGWNSYTFESGVISTVDGISLNVTLWQ